MNSTERWLFAWLLATMVHLCNELDATSRRLDALERQVAIHESFIVDATG